MRIIYMKLVQNEEEAICFFRDAAPPTMQALFFISGFNAISQYAQARFNCVILL